MELSFSGEYLVPGRSPAHLEADHLERYRFAVPYAAGRRVLDIACGAGYGAHMLATAGARQVRGVDLNPELVAHACARYTAPNLAFAAGDICDWSEDRPFELIASFETIEHVPDHRAALANLRRLLAPGGVLLISSPNRPVTTPWARSQSDRPANPHHVREFTPAELHADLQAAGFAVDSQVYGQRPQWHFRATLLRKAYKTLCRPWERADPAVRPVRRRTPEYFVLVAR